jgi:membrane associated rhomboid family serine protease
LSDHLPPRQAEPLFLVPWPVPAFAGVFLAIHVALVLAPLAWKGWAFASFALVPLRFLSDQAELVGLAVGNLLTYGFLHYDWLHVLFNVALLLAAAGPVMRNCGVVRLWLMFALCVIAGGIVHVLAYWGQPASVIGASAGAGGVIAAALRYRTRKLSLGEIVAPITRGPVAAFTLFWLGLNGAFFLWDRLGGGAIAGMATAAHIGGFLAGLFLAPVLVRGARAQTWPPRP